MKRKILRNLLLAALLANFQLTLVGCKRNPADVAAQVAKQYYDGLIKGKYAEFVDGTHRPDKIPDSYREQLIVNMKMFMNQQQREHRGIKETRIVNAVADSIRNEVNVFLVLCYGDSTTEEICVPMVESNGVWYLR